MPPSRPGEPEDRAALDTDRLALDHLPLVQCEAIRVLSWLRRLVERRIAAALAIVFVGVALTTSVPASAVSNKSAITPPVFAEVSSGIVLIKTRNCRNRPLGVGTGFLVGTRVVMTAQHVLRGACSIRAIVGNRSYQGSKVFRWYSDVSSVSATDLATFRLDRRSPGYVFDFARRTPKPRTTVAIAGHPLGNPLSLHQGRMIGTGKVSGVPTIAVWMVAAQGASGSPFLDPRGDVIGILQRGVVREDGGTLGCRSELPPKPPPPAPPPPPACSNDQDDDGDRKVDYGADPGCTSPSDTDETDPQPPPPPPVETVPVQDSFMSSTEACADRVQEFSLSVPRVYLCVFVGPFFQNHPARIEWVTPSGAVFPVSGTITPGHPFWFFWLDFGGNTQGGAWAVRFYFDSRLYGQVAFRRV
jgi:hypothetical protein